MHGLEPMKLADPGKLHLAKIIDLDTRRPPGPFMHPMDTRCIRGGGGYLAGQRPFDIRSTMSSASTGMSAMRSMFPPVWTMMLFSRRMPRPSSGM